MSSDPITRRRALATGIAGGAVAILPAAASAQGDDGELLQLFERWQRAFEQHHEASERFSWAYDRARAEYPPIPWEIRGKGKPPTAISEHGLRQTYKPSAYLEGLVAISRAWFAERDRVDAKHGVLKLTAPCDARLDEQFKLEHEIRALKATSPAGAVAQLIVTAMEAFDEDPPQIDTAADALREDLAKTMQAVGLARWPFFADDPAWLVDHRGAKIGQAV